MLLHVRLNFSLHLLKLLHVGLNHFTASPQAIARWVKSFHCTSPSYCTLCWTISPHPLNLLYVRLNHFTAPPQSIVRCAEPFNCTFSSYCTLGTSLSYCTLCWTISPHLLKLLHVVLNHFTTPPPTIVRCAEPFLHTSSSYCTLGWTSLLLLPKLLHVAL